MHFILFIVSYYWLEEYPQKSEDYSYSIVLSPDHLFLVKKSWSQNWSSREKMYFFQLWKWHRWSTPPYYGKFHNFFKASLHCLGHFKMTSAIKSKIDVTEKKILHGCTKEISGPLQVNSKSGRAVYHWIAADIDTGYEDNIFKNSPQAMKLSLSYNPSTINFK